MSNLTLANVINRRFVSKSQQKRETAEKAIAELGYRPNATGRSRKLAERLSIGMVVIDESPTIIASPFINLLLDGLSNFRNQCEYALVM